MSCSRAAKIERTLSFFSAAAAAVQLKKQELTFLCQVSQISRNWPFCTRSVKSGTDLSVPGQSNQQELTFSYHVKQKYLIFLSFSPGQSEQHTYLLHQVSQKQELVLLCTRSVSFKTAGTDINFCIRAVKAARISFFLSYQFSQNKNWPFPFVPDQPKQQELTFQPRSVKAKIDLFLYQISQNSKNWPFTPGQSKQKLAFSFWTRSAKTARTDLSHRISWNSKS